LGGGTFDLSILELTEGVFQVLSTNGNTRLGGDDLDKRLLDFLVEKIKATGGPDAAHDLPMLSRIREAAEQAKIKLSTVLNVEVALPFLTPGFSFTYQLTRTELENLTRDTIACARWPTRSWRPKISIKSSWWVDRRACRWCASS
jgi:molecular chaperone DnaK